MAEPGSGNPFVRAIVKGWQVSGITQFRSGRPLGSIGAACNLPNAGTCYADFNPDFSGPVRINGDYGDGDVLGANPPTYIDRAAFQSPAPFTFGNTPRTLAHDLRNPNYFNQDFSIRRDFQHRTERSSGFGVDVFNLFNNVVFGGHPDEHHQCEFRAGELAGQHAPGRADQSAAGVLTRW